MGQKMDELASMLDTHPADLVNELFVPAVLRDALTAAERVAAALELLATAQATLAQVAEANHKIAQEKIELDRGVAQGTKVLEDTLANQIRENSRGRA